MLLNRSEKLRHHGLSEGEEVVLAYAAVRACNVANLSLNIERVCEAVAGVPAAGFVAGAPSELPAPPANLHLLPHLPEIQLHWVYPSWSWWGWRRP